MIIIVTERDKNVPEATSYKDIADAMDYHSSDFILDSDVLYAISVGHPRFSFQGSELVNSHPEISIAAMQNMLAEMKQEAKWEQEHESIESWGISHV